MISTETDPTHLKSFKNGIEGCIWEWSGSKLEMLLRNCYASNKNPAMRDFTLRNCIYKNLSLKFLKHGEYKTRIEINSFR